MEHLLDMQKFIGRCKDSPDFSKEDTLEGLESRVVQLMQHVMAGPSMAAYSLPYPDNRQKMDNSDHESVKLTLQDLI